MSNYSSNSPTGKALDWDDEIEYTESNYITLPEGEYPFTVTGFERQNFDGGAKIPPCKMALVHLAIDGGSLGTAYADERLYLHTTMQWKLSEFFHSIGMLQKDGTVRMNWNAVPGASGWVKVTVNKYTNKDGQERTNNRVEHFLAPNDDTPAQFKPAAQPATGAPQWNG